MLLENCWRSWLGTVRLRAWLVVLCFPFSIAFTSSLIVTTLSERFFGRVLRTSCVLSWAASSFAEATGAGSGTLWCSVAMLRLVDGESLLRDGSGRRLLKSDESLSAAGSKSWEHIRQGIAPWPNWRRTPASSVRNGQRANSAPMTTCGPVAGSSTTSFQRCRGSCWRSHGGSRKFGVAGRNLSTLHCWKRGR